MILTREEAIRKHREMWNWISSFLMYYKPSENDDIFSPYELKLEYIRRYQKEDIDIENLCYLCEYKCKTNMRITTDIALSCSDCLLDWGEITSCMSAYSPYKDFSSLLAEKKYSECSKIARQIANLPEREEK